MPDQPPVWLSNLGGTQILQDGQLDVRPFAQPSVVSGRIWSLGTKEVIDRRTGKSSVKTTLFHLPSYAIDKALYAHMTEWMNRADSMRTFSVECEFSPLPGQLKLTISSRRLSERVAGHMAAPINGLQSRAQRLHVDCLLCDTGQQGEQIEVVAGSGQL
jgi:hypothetical protein